MFQEKGWHTISELEVYNDPVFSKIPVFTGDSLIWSMAKDSEEQEDKLRYLIKDSRYEKKEMDSLGL
ncbi:MAG: hypothetical protein ACJARG_001864 [Arcticibacterium sp.]|jgi:hypothetical protein